MKNLLLVAISFIVALVAGEVLLRLFYETPPTEMDEFKLTESSSYAADPELGWLPRPNATGEHNRRGSFESRYSTNSLGLRDGEHPFEKPQGVTRIVVLGDSFTWGYGVNDGEVFTDLIEQRDSSIEVINLGVAAFGLPQEFAYFQRLGMRFDPDILIIAFVQNDVYSPRADAPVLADPAAATIRKANRDSWFRRLKSTLGDNLVMYQLLVTSINGNPAALDFMVDIGLKESLAGLESLDPSIGTALKDSPPVIEAGWGRTFDQLRAMKSHADEHGYRLILALVPALQSVDPSALARSASYTVFQPADFDVEMPYAKVEAFAAANGIEVINPLRAYQRGFAAGQRLYFHRDIHFTPAGHRLFADEIVRYLADR